MSNIRAGSQTGLTLVTGATGFVGAGLVAKLARDGVETLACVRGDLASLPGDVRVVPVSELTANTGNYSARCRPSNWIQPKLG